MQETPAPALDSIEGFQAEGDVIGVTMGMLDGRKPVLINPMNWPVPPVLRDYVELDMLNPTAASERLGITDELIPITAGVAFLRPPSLIVALATPSDADPSVFEAALTDGLASAQLSRSSVTRIAMAEEHSGIAFPKLGIEPLFVPDEVLLRLAADAEREGSPRTEAELLALAAGKGFAHLVFGDHRFGEINVAVARVRPPSGN